MSSIQAVRRLGRSADERTTGANGSPNIVELAGGDFVVVGWMSPVTSTFHSFPGPTALPAKGLCESTGQCSCKRGATFLMRDEIRPPAWSVAGARQLSLAEFGAEFGVLWSGLRHGLVKSECWQTYQEPETQSWLAYQRGDYAAVPALLEREASFDQVVYDAVTANDTPFVRVRVVRLPLSEYLTFEMWNYIVRARRGETIEILVLPADDQRPLPDHTYFDFLLFDDSAALIHDYGLDGLQTGGWATTEPSVLGRLEESATLARKDAIPLATFLAAQGRTFLPVPQHPHMESALGTR
jgi:hypothetical protein